MSSNVEQTAEVERAIAGVPVLSVNIGRGYEAFQALGRSTDKRFWILIDEWSSVPEELQPFIADFIKRTIFTVQNITVQVAAIEYRSRFKIDQPGFRVGFELGSDIFADINLDDFFVYENNPDVAANFFRDILFKHVVAISDKGELKEASPQQMTDSAFTQEPAFRELVRASEGVPRDLINILQMAAMRAGSEKISVPMVRNAAKDWYERDKERNIDQNAKAQSLLAWIRDKVIFGRKAMAFLVPSTIKDEVIELLFDERLLHIAKRSYSHRDNVGVRYRVWKLDYGCYVDLINTHRAPNGFLFEGLETEAGDIVVPEDDFRAVRRAVLNIDEFNAETRTNEVRQ